MPHRPPKATMRRPHWARGKPRFIRPLEQSKDQTDQAAVHNITERYRQLRRRGAPLPPPQRFYGTAAELTARLDEAEAELNRYREITDAA